MHVHTGTWLQPFCKTRQPSPRPLQTSYGRRPLQNCKGGSCRQQAPLQSSFLDSSTTAKQAELHAEQHSRPSTTRASEENGASPRVIAEPSTSSAPTAKSGVRVRVQGMVKHFNTKKGLFKAVDGVDLDVEPNKLYALLGPSGSGKTTLLRLIAGLEEATSGSIFFDDLDATNLLVQDRRIGFVFQSYALFNHMTVAENIAFSIRMRSLGGDQDARVAELLELVDLPGLGGRYPKQLSGGQMQRVAVARALASNPRLLLLDEPFGALDPEVRRSLRAGLRQIIDRVGITGIFVTHDQEEAFDIADQVVVFNAGTIVQQGAPEELVKRPASPFVMQFVSDVNMVPSTCAFVRRMGYQTAKPMVMFRPRGDITVFKTYSSAQTRTQPATISDKLNIGYMIKYWMRFDDGVRIEFHVLRDEDKDYDMEINQRVYIQVKPLSFMAFSPEEISASTLQA